MDRRQRSTLTFLVAAWGRDPAFSVKYAKGLGFPPVRQFPLLESAIVILTGGDRRAADANLGSKDFVR